MYRVIKAIHFSYGHRLLHHPGKCERMHGHNARVEIEVSSEKLNEQGMVIDFEEIRKSVGNWIDEVLDHRMILWEKDPVAEVLKGAGESLVLTQEHPTAEILAKWIFEEAQKRKLPISKVVLWETPDSCAIYRE